MKVPSALRGARAAVAFMTRVPIGGFPYKPRDWSWAPAHFPLVGSLVGAAGAAAIWFSLRVGLGAQLAALLSLLTVVLLTGAFHEDGLADSADALGGAHGPKRIHEILKDSRLGSFGVTALAFSLLLRAGCLGELGAEALGQLVWVHTLARLGPVWLMVCLPYVSEGGGKGSHLARGCGPSRGVTASAWTLGCAVGMLAFGAPVELLLAQALASGVLTLLCGIGFKRRVAGYTGDFLGATEQLCEVSALLLAVATLAGGA